MENFESVEDVLNFAIEREEKAHALYTQLAGNVKNPRIHKVFNDLALEELEHKIKLQAVKAGEVQLNLEEVGNLKIADKIKFDGYRPGMTYAEILVMAMKKETISYELYTRLAAACGQEKIKEMFQKLAQEEAQHRLRFEIEYDLITF